MVDYSNRHKRKKVGSIESNMNIQGSGRTAEKTLFEAISSIGFMYTMERPRFSDHLEAIKVRLSCKIIDFVGLHVLAYEALIGDCSRKPYHLFPDSIGCKPLE
ncbi:hypothetical protein CFP56_018623 [Quercus suber]|uniref:Uncharacterized protein n=1 Tax=Quercus suber TaxID=58331 RepID=A0AAW0M2J1_QUESU